MASDSVFALWDRKTVRRGEIDEVLDPGACCGLTHCVVAIARGAPYRVFVRLPSVMTGIWRLRAAVLILVGALAVHHGRYLFATREHEHELAAAHSYLPWLGCASAMLLFLAVVQLGAYIARANEAPRLELPRARTLWLFATGTLLTVFGAQESAEMFVAHGHLPELAELLGAGGWTAVPLALAAGAVIALSLRGAATVLRWALGRRRRPVVRLAPRALLAPQRPLLAAPRSVLARRLAGRGPPALSSVS